MDTVIPVPISVSEAQEVFVDACQQWKASLPPRPTADHSMPPQPLPRLPLEILACGVAEDPNQFVTEAQNDALAIAVAAFVFGVFATIAGRRFVAWVRKLATAHRARAAS